jgi:hypothetical protein
LTFKADGLRGSNAGTPCPMWHILNHGNDHFNGVCLLDVSSWTNWYTNDVDHHKLDLSPALEDHPHNFLQLTNKATTSGCLVSPSAIKSTQAATRSIMTHIAHHLSTAGLKHVAPTTMLTHIPEGTYKKKRRGEASKVYPYILEKKMYQYILSPPKSVPVHFGGEIVPVHFLPLLVTCY